MQFTKDDLATLSRLARITIKEGEEEKMLHDMQAILQYVSEVNEIALEESTLEHSHANILREDAVAEESLSKREIILENAPEVEDSYIKVTQVLQA